MQAHHSPGADSAPVLTRPRRLARQGSRRQLVHRTAQVLHRISSWRVWVPSAVVYAAFAWVFFASSAPFAVPVVAAACGQPPLDVRFTSNAAAVTDYLQACGPAGREAYQALQVADLLYPLVFAVFLASSLGLVLRHLAPRRPGLALLALLPILASALDYTENALAWRALVSFPEASTGSGMLGLATAAKSITSWAATGLLVTACTALLARSGRRRLASRLSGPERTMSR